MPWKSLRHAFPVEGMVEEGETSRVLRSSTLGTCFSSWHGGRVDEFGHLKEIVAV